MSAGPAAARAFLRRCRKNQNSTSAVPIRNTIPPTTPPAMAPAFEPLEVVAVGETDAEVLAVATLLDDVEEVGVEAVKDEVVELAAGAPGSSARFSASVGL